MSIHKFSKIFYQPSCQIMQMFHTGIQRTKGTLACEYWNLTTFSSIFARFPPKIALEDAMYLQAGRFSTIIVAIGFLKRSDWSKKVWRIWKRGYPNVLVTPVPARSMPLRCDTRVLLCRKSRKRAQEVI